MQFENEKDHSGCCVKDRLPHNPNKKCWDLSLPQERCKTERDLAICHDMDGAGGCKPK